MSRPTSKDELLRVGETQFEKLCALIESMSEEEQLAAVDFSADPTKKEAHWRRDRCLRDVLVHLYEWHRLLLTWVETNRGGRSAPFLPAPYNWKTYGQLNERFWSEHQSTSLEDAKRLVRSTHDQVMALIVSLTDAELFEKGQFAWTGTTTLGSYCVSATSSHYEWAMKKIRAHLKRLRSGA
ncbi:MAG: ClbS/DfsB family four-helix bundle protein [Propionibacteriaceae bacterium]|nr:ClbS/DfsB family four-helix bundle protein [Propionibacteriaceae bacterium]